MDAAACGPPRTERWSRPAPPLESASRPVLGGPPPRPPPSCDVGRGQGLDPGTPSFAPSPSLRALGAVGSPCERGASAGPGLCGIIGPVSAPPRGATGDRAAGEDGRRAVLGRARWPERAGSFVGRPGAREPSPHFRANSDTCSLTRHMSRRGTAARERLGLRAPPHRPPGAKGARVARDPQGGGQATQPSGPDEGSREAGAPPAAPGLQLGASRTKDLAGLLCPDQGPMEQPSGHQLGPDEPRGPYWEEAGLCSASSPAPWSSRTPLS